MSSNDTNNSFHIAAIVLAAGESKRFNSPKQLAMIGNKPLLVHSIEILKQSNLSAINIVLGANSQAIQRVIEQFDINSNAPVRLHTLIAEDWKQGMGASLAYGVKKLDRRVTHVFVGLADQVEISTKQCNLMIAKANEYPTKIVAAAYQGKLGAPAIFPSTYFPHLAQLSNDQGARAILQAHATNVIAVDLPEAAKDIDTESDLRDYLQRKH